MEFILKLKYMTSKINQRHITLFVQWNFGEACSQPSVKWYSGEVTRNTPGHTERKHANCYTQITIKLQ